MTDAMQRQRTTTVSPTTRSAWSRARRSRIPVSKHPVDSINLADPRLGLLDAVNELLAQSRRRARPRRPGRRSDRAQRRPHGQRVRNAADAERPGRRAARPAALRAIKARNVLQRSARDSRQDAQLREIRRRARAQLADGGAAARPGIVRAAGGQGDVAAGAPLPALAPRQLPAAGGRQSKARPRSLRGTYQSPILVQWQSAERQERRIDIVLV